MEDLVQFHNSCFWNIKVCIYNMCGQTYWVCLDRKCFTTPPPPPPHNGMLVYCRVPQYLFCKCLFTHLSGIMEPRERRLAWEHSTIMTTHCDIERFSFECWKVIGFAITMLHDWLKRFAPLFHPRSKIKPIVTRSHAFSRALCQLHVITLTFDWFTVFCVLCDWLE